MLRLSWSRAAVFTTGRRGVANPVRARSRTPSCGPASGKSLPAVGRPTAVPGWRRCWAAREDATRIARLMRQERIFARQRSKYRARTTDSCHGGPIAPNRVQNLLARRPDQVWVSDATGVFTGQGWLYLVAVLDVFTRRVIGWAMSPILDAPLVSAALRMALSQRRPARSLTLHSDRGSQFASAAYRGLLAQHGLVASVRRPGNW